MGISDFISRQKQALRERETAHFKKKAEKLAVLRQDRIRKEGQAKILSIEQKEKAKLEKANAKVKAGRFSGLKNAKQSLSGLKKSGNSGNPLFNLGGSDNRNNSPFLNQTHNSSVWSGSGANRSVWTGEKPQPQRKKRKNKGRGKSITINY